MKNITVFCSVFALNFISYVYSTENEFEAREIHSFQETNLTANTKNDDDFDETYEHETFNSEENEINPDDNDNEHEMHNIGGNEPEPNTSEDEIYIEDNEHDVIEHDEAKDDLNNHIPYCDIDKNLIKQIKELNQKVSALTHSMLYRPPITVNTTIKKEAPPLPKEEEKITPLEVNPKKVSVFSPKESLIFIHRGNKHTEIQKMQ